MPAGKYKIETAVVEVEEAGFAHRFPARFPVRFPGPLVPFIDREGAVVVGQNTQKEQQSCLCLD